MRVLLLHLLRLVHLPFALLRLLVQSALLALGQVWANKARSILTMIGIIIGVASVTTVIAVLSGLKANVLREFETLGTNKIFLVSQRPSKGPGRTAPPGKSGSPPNNWTTCWTIAPP